MILAGDIGGTNTRLALYDLAGDGARFEPALRNREFPRFEGALARFLACARAPR